MEPTKTVFVMEVKTWAIFWGVILTMFMLCYCGCAKRIGKEFELGRTDAAQQVYSQELPAGNPFDRWPSRRPYLQENTQ